MKKLLGLFLCGCMAVVLSMGAVGCTKAPEKDKAKDGKDKDGKDKVEVKIKDIGEQKLKAKTGDQKVTVALEADAPVELAVSAKADKVSGSGTIKKGEKSGDIMVKTEDGAKSGDVTVTVASTDKTKEATKTFKATIE